MKNIVSWSGGKDSTAMLYYLLYEMEIQDLTVVYMDTTIVTPDVPAYIDQIQKDWNFDLVILKPIKTFWELLEEKRFFPTIKYLWCLRELKKKPFKTWVTNQLDSIKNIFIGVRRAESPYRNKHYTDKIRVTSRPDKIINLYPLLDWSNRDVEQYFKKNNIPKNPAYEKLGISSCYVCPFLHKKHYLRLRSQYPRHYETIRKYESRIHRTAMCEMVSLTDLAAQQTL